MLRSFFFVTLVAAVSVAAAACGSDTGSSDSTGTSGGVTVEQACASFASAACSKLSSCSSFFLELTYGDEATCRDRLGLTCPPSVGAPGSSQSAADWQACANDIPSLGCDAIFERNLPQSCRPKEGTLPDGAACGDSSQCRTSNCDTNDKECGVCAPIVAAGSACMEEDDCDYGLTCAQSKCVKRAEMGATCDAATPCKVTLACSGGKCAAPAGAGEPCGAMAAGCDTLKGLGCNAMNVCQKVKLVGPGEVCGQVGLDFIGCKGGGKCKVAVGGMGMGTCLAPAADGAACGADDGPECQDPATCSNDVCTLSDPASCK